MADRRLQVFHAVAKYGSFTRAAEYLYMTQPAVTFQIKQLEESFNTRLFERGHGRVTLTPAGEIVLAYAGRILDISEELESRVAEMTQELSGVLNIGASTTIAVYWLPYLLEEFKRLYPGVIPRMVVGNSQLTEDRVATRELDIGLIEIAGEQTLVDHCTAAYDELLVICHPDYPLAQKKEITAQDLLTCPFVNRDPGNAIRIMTEEFVLKAGLDMEQMPVYAEIGSLSAIKYLLSQKCGYAISSRASVKHETAQGVLCAIPLSPRIYAPLEIIIPKDKFRSLLITTFADFATEKLRGMAEPFPEATA